jgi:hypothetical protein
MQGWSGASRCDENDDAVLQRSVSNVNCMYSRDFDQNVYPYSSRTREDKVMRRLVYY